MVLSLVWGAVLNCAALFLCRVAMSQTSQRNIDTPYICRMSKIIAIGNQKGGTGKTTVTCLLANALSQPPFNLRVFVADCDPQQSIIRRRLSDQKQTSEPAPYPVAFYNTLAELQADIERLDKDNDIVFLDLPGRLDTWRPADQQETTRFLQYVDFLFIPFCPGNYALESTLDYLRIVVKIAHLRKANPRPLSVVGFVNQYEGGRTVDDRALLQDIAELQDVVKIGWMETRLQRYALFRAIDTFTTFYDQAGADKATQNISKFITEFKKTIL